MADKEVTAQFKIQAIGGQATPAPPLGPVLGANGVNPGQFIQQFNAMTQEQSGKLVAAVVTAYKDRSFDIEIKSSPAPALIKEAAGIEKGSGEPNKNKVGTMTFDQCRAIAQEKIKDLNAADIDAAARMIAGTARSMGVTVEGN
jgi:large subunit ribosomal protein L11